MSSKPLLMVFALITLTATAFGGQIGSIVVYGDSLSDNGNLFAAIGQPAAPYYLGRSSNGPVAVEQLAANLGVLPANFQDFAWAGATTGIGNHLDGGSPTTFVSLPGMATEFSLTQAALGPYMGGLFIVWGGPNDFLSPSPLDTTPQQIIGRAVTDLVTLVGGLEAMGARSILVPGMPDLGLTPYFRSIGQGAQGTLLTDAFNTALSGALLQANFPGVKFFDSASLLRSVVNNPAAYGLTNVTDPCFNGTSVCANPGEYLFWDDLHPTTSADATVARAFEASVAPEPATILFAAAGLGLLIVARRRLAN